MIRWWEVVNSKIVFRCVTLSVDDTVLDKPYSDPLKLDLQVFQTKSFL